MSRASTLEERTAARVAAVGDECELRRRFVVLGYDGQTSQTLATMPGYNEWDAVASFLIWSKSRGETFAPNYKLVAVLK